MVNPTPVIRSITVEFPAKEMERMLHLVLDTRLPDLEILSDPEELERDEENGFRWELTREKLAQMKQYWLREGTRRNGPPPQLKSDMKDNARLYGKVMTEMLGDHRYVVHGGDWGSMIAAHPDEAPSFAEEAMSSDIITTTALPHRQPSHLRLGVRAARSVQNVQLAQEPLGHSIFSNVVAMTPVSWNS
ncbi:hypothetical protein K437DRAFT_268653 [Tilletiaria anomala UBC 951]|uniref:Epoxide hydrolase N-terminal domain-containing protein n=1 Tax=Tilletiaria anomala (strain ATCC 24038 / CBS 436.72 / UBC 951) TaxID=1037660 RepID=A0A066VSM5_TILAU|nr:uncharacterized protein K437DRAFT_268653 [Tilletiaria anomala UBC 951]KDN44737.1 hypothetical protein K437DRAFT_268653 [Tilletiaria anomala UBC 951]